MNRVRVLLLALSVSLGAYAQSTPVDPATVWTVSPAAQGLSGVTTATAGSTIVLTSATAGAALNGPRGVNTHQCILTMGGTTVSAAAVVVQASHDGGSTWFGIPGGWVSPAISKTGTYISGANGWYPRVRCNLITFTGSSPTATVTYIGWNGKQDPSPGSFFRCQTNNNSAITSTTVSTDTGAIGGVSSTSACANHASLASIAMTITQITFSSSVASTSTSNQQMILQMGTSTACTSPVVLWSAYSPTTGGATIRFNPGELTTANANSLCFLHAATGSKSVTVVGVYGPWNG